MEYLAYIIKPLLLALVLGWMGASIRKAPQKTYRGKKLLRMAGPIAALMWVCLLLPLGALLGLALSDERGDLSTWIIAVLVCGPFLAAGLYLWRYKQYHKVLYDDRKLEITNSSGQTAILDWSSIERVSYSINWGFLYIESNAKRFKVSNTMQGFSSFLKDLNRLTGHDTSGFRSPYG